MRLREEDPIGSRWRFQFRQQLFFPRSWVVHRRSGAKQGPQWSQSAACMINCVAFNSGHKPAATSCRSIPSSAGQSIPGDAAFETTTSENWFASCQHRDTFLPQSTHDLHGTLRFANCLREKPMQPLLGLRRRRHESVKLFVTDVFIEWTAQIPTPPT